MQTFTLHCGDALVILKTLDSESVHCCVTSPPYWGLRDYGTPGQLGLERTPEEYVSRMVEVFREVRRVLKDDGTLWLNLGDSYAGGGCGARDEERWPKQSRNDHMPTHAKKQSALKPKDLIGIPWRVAFALQADGWYLRSDIIWHKPNPMPESVRDRPTKAHEYLFLLAKQERYFYDTDAIAEPQEENERTRRLREQRTGLATVYSLRRDFPHGQRPPGPSGVARTAKARQDLALKGTRNRRSVWTIATQPYPEAHFATFPEDLVRPCILAGCPEGGTVLDSFCGTSTVGAVALLLNRAFIGIDLNPKYLKMGEPRLYRASSPLFEREEEFPREGTVGSVS